MERHVLTKPTRDGRTVDVYITTAGPRYTLTATMDGKRLGEGYLSYRSPDLPPGAVAAIGKAAFSQEEADQIQAVVDQVRTALPPDLRLQRETLVYRLHGASEAMAQAKASAYDEGEPQVFHTRQQPGMEADVEAARAELERFDAAHPEVVAQIEREKKERVNRVIDNGL